MQCAPGPWHGGHTDAILDITSEINCSWRESIREHRDHYNKELADLVISLSVYRPGWSLTIVEVKGPAGLYLLSKSVWKHIECFHIVSVASEVGLIFLSGRTLNGVLRYINEAVGIHPTHAVALVSLTSNALNLESHALFEVIHFAQHSDMVSGSDPNPPLCSPDPSSYLFHSFHYVSSRLYIPSAVVLPFTPSRFFKRQTF